MTDDPRNERLASDPFVAALRRVVVAGEAEWAPEREAAFVEHVLAHTTRRQAPTLSLEGVRGSLEGVRGALARSGLVRLVAASLVLHVGALGVVAMLAVRERRETPALRIELPREADAPFVEHREDELALEPPPPLADDLEAARAEARANRLRLDRFLAARDAQLLVGATDGARLRTLLERRREHLEARDWLVDGRLAADLAPSATGWRGPEDLVLVATLLDAYLFTGEDAVVRALGPRLAVLDEAPAETRDAVERLRARAVAYGLLAGPESTPRHPLRDLSADPSAHRSAEPSGR